jgi:hypothetical protein
MGLSICGVPIHRSGVNAALAYLSAAGD